MNFLNGIAREARKKQRFGLKYLRSTLYSPQEDIMPRLFLFALLLALLSGCVVPVGGATPAPAPAVTSTPFSTDTPQPSKTPIPTLTETPTATATQTETATANETQTLNPAEMQTESGVHGVKLDVTGSCESCQGVILSVSVGIAPDINEAIGGKGVEFNDKASPIPAGERLVEATLRVWYNAYLQRNPSVKNYSFEKYLADYKSGKDVTVDEWVYDPATKTSSVMKVDPDTHVMYVVAEGMKWYGVGENYFQGFTTSIVKAPDGGIIVVRGNANFAAYTTQEKRLSHIDSDLMNGMAWLYQPVERQKGDRSLNVKLPDSEKALIANLMHPDYFSNWQVEKCLLTINP
jgi:hypothetical protein